MNSIKKFVWRPKTFWGKEIEYVMPRDEFDVIANKRDYKNVDPWKFVLDYINNNYGLLGTVTALAVEEKIPGMTLLTVLD